MKHFAELLDRLYFTYSYLDKKELLKNYLANTKDPDRGYAIAIIAGVLSFKNFKRKMIYELVTDEVDEVLFSLSYDYVGDLSETISLIWPNKNKKKTEIPNLSSIIENLSLFSKDEIKEYIRDLFNELNPKERWALVKIATGDVRIGVSARFLKQTLADYGNKPIQEIEEVWHALSPPYENLFAWLENCAPKPDLVESLYFHPVMLSQPLNENDFNKINLREFSAEWKYDGIRVQIVSTSKGRALFSRTGDNISQAFPDIVKNINFHGVLDGELVVRHENQIGLFNDLQQRLNRKKPNAKLIHDYPGHIILYDALMLHHQDLRNLAYIKRREALENWYKTISSNHFSLSPLLEFKDVNTLKGLRGDVEKHPNPAVEGVMLKRNNSLYIPGRPRGQWFKWKRDPFVIDAVMMYAERGHGIRSSFYSDYTFGLWQNDTILPIGKAYFGFTDEELHQLDKWIRKHTLQKFGPVREVEKKLVLEIAFEGIQHSSRHKSGYALRFPRVNRIRWDKPAKEADKMETLQDLYHQANIKK